VPGHLQQQQHSQHSVCITDRQRLSHRVLSFSNRFMLCLACLAACLPAFCLEVVTKEC
jgi:hypothetical protein